MTVATATTTTAATAMMIPPPRLLRIRTTASPEGPRAEIRCKRPSRPCWCMKWTITSHHHRKNIAGIPRCRFAKSTIIAMLVITSKSSIISISMRITFHSSTKSTGSTKPHWKHATCPGTMPPISVWYRRMPMGAAIVVRGPIVTWIRGTRRSCTSPNSPKPMITCHMVDSIPLPRRRHNNIIRRAVDPANDPANDRRDPSPGPRGPTRRTRVNVPFCPRARANDPWDPGPSPLGQYIRRNGRNPHPTRTKTDPGHQLTSRDLAEVPDRADEEEERGRRTRGSPKKARAAEIIITKAAVRQLPSNGNPS
mmetsp:Transcript_30139/g.65050  ORF Transcript_30139/g.65050 Transcript_30139/m.65050 type:complete len:309 (-) Transcript_30139:708-1634(-)